MIGFSTGALMKRTGSGGNFPDIPDNTSAAINRRDPYGQSELSASQANAMLEAGISFAAMEQMYKHNIWVRAIVDKIVERAANVQPLIKPIQTTADKIPDKTKRSMERIQEFLIRPNDQFEPFTHIAKKAFRDELKFDAGGIEIALQIAGSKAMPYIYNVPGNTIRKNVDKQGLLIAERAYSQLDVNNKEIASWPATRFMYFMNNPQSNRHYGFSPLETLVQTVTAELYSSNYNLDFFKNNATPRIAVMMKGLGIGQGATALQRFRQWWDNELQGNPHRPIILGTEQGEIDIEKVALSNKDMEFMEYSLWLLQKIAAVYKIPLSILGIQSERQNTGDIDTQLMLFKVEAINPLLSGLYQRLNLHLIFNPQLMNIQDAYVDYDLDISDKEKMAKVHESYLRGGILTINEIRSQGLGLPPVPWGNVPYMQNNVAPFGVGPNGAAVPITQDPNMQPADPGSAPATIDNGVVSRSLPVGWERMDATARKEVVTKLVQMRERVLSKKFFIG